MTGDMRKVKVTRVAARRMKVRAVLVTMMLVALAGLSSYSQTKRLERDELFQLFF